MFIQVTLFDNMPIFYDSSSDDSYYRNDDGCSDNGDDFIECNFCDAQVKQKNMQRHLENVHQCPHCSNNMPKDSLAAHIERKHMVTCKYCGAEVLANQIGQHKARHFVGCQYCGAEVLANQIGQHEAGHFVPCKYCALKIFEEDVDKHVSRSHPLESIIGMIQILNISDTSFNSLVARNRVFAKGGHIYIRPE